MVMFYVLSVGIGNVGKVLDKSCLLACHQAVRSWEVPIMGRSCPVVLSWTIRCLPLWGETVG